ncbi:MAG: hypothetical protein PHQ28_15855, partial [Mycobacterium sp.]|nr:hypothetical protein [Mycobacterium sp.]
DSMFRVRLEAASVDALAALLSQLEIKLADASNITVGIEGSDYIATITPLYCSCVEVPMESNEDSAALVHAFRTTVDISVRRKPYLLTAQETIFESTLMAAGLVDPVGISWPATYGRAESQINHLTNPSMELDTGGLPTSWSVAGGAASPTHTKVASDISPYKWRFQYTGAAGDSNATIHLRHAQSAAGTAAEGDIWALSFYAAGASAGVTFQATVLWYNAANTYIGASSTTNFTIAAGWDRKIAVSAAAPANTDRARAQISILGVHTADTVDLYLDNAQLEKLPSGVSTATEYFDGTRDKNGGNNIYSAWSGTADASTSIYYGIAAYHSQFRINISGGGGVSGYSPEFAVDASTAYMPSCEMQVVSWTAGSVYCSIYWYTSAHVYISQSVIRTATAADGSPVSASARVTSPATAAYGKFFTVAAAGSWLICTFDTEAITEDVLWAPGAYELESLGQFAAPVEGTFDAMGSELAALYAGVYEDVTASIADFAIEAVDLPWSGGSATTDSAGYPDGAGNTVQRNQSATEIYADLVVTGYEDGEYLFLAKSKATAANAGTIRHAYCDAVDIPTTALALLNLGMVTLPCSSVRGTAASTLRVYLAGDGTNYGYVNVFFLVPASRGLIAWQMSSGHAHAITHDGRIIYADDVADFEHAPGPKPLITRGGLLVVVAEQATPEPVTGLVTTLTTRPRYAQLPGS